MELDKKRKMEAATDLKNVDTQTIEQVPSGIQLAEGTILLGRYMLMRQIGQGGTSSVYRVRDMLAVLGGDESESHIAAKIVKVPPASASNHEQQMMLREALTTRHLAHPNILKVYDYHQDGDLYFVTMELIEGESLADLVARKPNKKLAYKQVKAIISAVAAGLTEAHQNGVIHSDVKPSNILISESGEIKVIDFATARSYIDARVKGQKIDDGANYYGFTLAYASPQTIADEPASPSDDVFSLACIVYELLSGKHPYARKPTSTIAKKYVPPRPKEIGLFQWLVLRKGLSLVASKRYSSVNEFVSRLFFAKNLLSYATVFTGVAVGLVLGVSSLINTVNAYIDTRSAHESAYQQLSYQQQLVSSLLANLPENSASLVQHLQGIEGAERQVVLASIKGAILDKLSAQAKNVLGYSAASVQASHFDDFLAHASGYKAIFPDSNKLLGLLADVESERNAYALGLQHQYYSFWQTTNFSQADARHLDLLQEKILSFDPVFEVVLGADVTSMISNKVDDAIANNNISQLAQINAFINGVGKPHFEFLLPEQLRALSNAVLVANYLAGLKTDAADTGEYPIEATLYFIKEDLKALESSIADLWFDKDMAAVSDTLLALVTDFSIPADSPVMTSIQQKLLEKLEGKLKFHKRKGNSESIVVIQGLIDKHKAVNSSQAVL